MSRGRKRREEENGVEREKRAKLQDTRSILLSAQYVSFMTRERERKRGGREERDRKRDNNLSRSRNTKNKSATQ